MPLKKTSSWFFTAGIRRLREIVTGPDAKMIHALR